MLINDERTRQDFAYRFDVRVDGKDVIKLDGTGALDPSQTLFVPLRFRVPDLAGKASCRGDDDSESADRFAPSIATRSPFTCSPSRLPSNRP